MVIDTSALIAILLNEADAAVFAAALVAAPKRMIGAVTALARQHHLPLLFKGNDFGQTDILVAGLPVAH